MSKSNVFRDGEVHVMSERCSTCIFRPGNPMRLTKGRVRAMVSSCMATPGGNIPCHQTLDLDHQAICRGYWDGYSEKDVLLTAAERLSIVVFDGVGHQDRGATR